MRALDRREFLQSAGGLALGFALVPGALVGVRDARAGANGLTANAWVHITPQGAVVIECPTAEMGQGIFTSLPLVLAEELDADWSRVRVVQAPASEAYVNPVHFKSQGVGGSRSMRGYWLPMRLAGAQARRILLVNAAAHWGVPQAELATEPGRVVHAASGRALGYGEIAAFATLPANLPPVTEADLKPRAQWRLIGRDVPRVEVPAKVNGSAGFGIDVQLPGMLYASILRPPVAATPHPQFAPDIGIPPVRVDDREALAIEGVARVVPLDHGVAVVGTGYWATVLGKRALRVEWRTGAKAERYDSDAVLKDFAAILRDPSRKGEVRSVGDTEAAFRGAATVVAGEYFNDHVYHAALEPLNATAWVRGDEVDLWSPTQGQTWSQEVAAKAAGTVPEKVRVHTTLLGGGFGLKTEQLTTAQAVQLAKLMGKPVKVIWSREDDMRQGAYRPLAAQRIEAALATDGRVVGWRHRLVADSVTLRARRNQWQGTKGYDVVVMSGAATAYAIPNKLHEYVHEDRGIPVGYWNANGAGFTKFAGESFVDELAAKLGRDPLALRLDLIGKGRGRLVLETVAQMSEWSRKRAGRGLGLAYYDGGEWACDCAQVAEVSVDRATGAITVHKIWAAVDPGIAVQPAHLVQQIETGIVWGLGAALRERITIKAGEVQQANFHQYLVTRMNELPEVEVRLVSSGERISGGGQIGVAPVAPAIANAVAALTGARVRELPMLPERVQAALRQAA